MERERVETAGPGRPRSEKAHKAILKAAISLVRDVGYDALSIQAVAARARVSKATVYRRWSSREDLVAEAVEQIIRSFPPADHGSLKKDLDALFKELLGMYSDPRSAAMLSSLVSAMARSEPIAKALRSGFISARRQALREALMRASGRGDLRRDVDLELVVDLLSGPLFYRFLVTGQPVDDGYTRRLVDTLLQGISVA